MTKILLIRQNPFHQFQQYHLKMAIRFQVHRMLQQILYREITMFPVLEILVTRMCLYQDMCFHRFQMRVVLVVMVDEQMMPCFLP